MISYRAEVEAARLDRLLGELAPEIPRTRWTAWIAEGKVLVNGEPAFKAGQKIRVGNLVETELPTLAVPGFTAVPEAIDLPTLYEDDRLWIIDKPDDMVVHPAPGHPTGTILNALLYRLGARAEGAFEDAPETHDAMCQMPGALMDEEVFPAPIWPGLVHRLDRHTTGCLVLTKDREAQLGLQAQFKERTVEKRYLAICRMSRKLPEIGSLLVDAPIARHRLERLKMTVNPEGRAAQTRVRLLAKGGGMALVECELLTGRTHQIRLHLSHLGAPLLGDPIYGGAGRWLDIERLPMEAPYPFLHAWKLSINHPGDGRRMDIQAPIPERFREAVRRLDMVLPTA